MMKNLSCKIFHIVNDRHHLAPYEKMKVVCINNLDKKNIIFSKNNIYSAEYDSFDETYFIYNIPASYVNDGYWFHSSDAAHFYNRGHQHLLNFSDYFISLKEYRKQKLKKIINKII